MKTIKCNKLSCQSLCFLQIHRNEAIPNITLQVGFASNVFCEATRAKEVFGKHVESVLQKLGKIRSLIADLQKNYGEDVTAKKYLGKSLKIFEWFCT